jgi:hypothetical protein
MEETTGPLEVVDDLEEEENDEDEDDDDDDEDVVDEKVCLLLSICRFLTELANARFVCSNIDLLMRALSLL